MIVYSNIATQPPLVHGMCFSVVHNSTSHFQHFGTDDGLSFPITSPHREGGPRLSPARSSAVRRGTPLKRARAWGGIRVSTARYVTLPWCCVPNAACGRAARCRFPATLGRQSRRVRAVSTATQQWYVLTILFHRHVVGSHLCDWAFVLFVLGKDGEVCLLGYMFQCLW